MPNFEHIQEPDPFDLPPHEVAMLAYIAKSQVRKMDEELTADLTRVLSEGGYDD